MVYFKDIVCFANSRKKSGWCVAGKQWANGDVGSWVRPVSNRATREISMEEQVLSDGAIPRLLDILRIPMSCPAPLTHQVENHIIDAHRPWSRQGALNFSRVEEWLDTPDQLWSLGESSYYGQNNRIPVGSAAGESLCLIAVEKLVLRVGPKAPEYGEYRRVIRGTFYYRGVLYCMDVTDPVIACEYNTKPDGSYDINKPVLCLSLSDEYNGHFYKLIAAVLWPGRHK